VNEIVAAPEFGQHTEEILTELLDYSPPGPRVEREVQRRPRERRLQGLRPLRPSRSRRLVINHWISSAAGSLRYSAEFSQDRFCV
jgi:hypothetical protein